MSTRRGEARRGEARRFAWVLAFGVALGVGCSVDEGLMDPPNEHLGKAGAPVYIGGDGHAWLDHQEHPQVVRINRFNPNEGPGTCTASLVASNVLLTAAHCFDNGYTFLGVTEPMSGDENAPVDEVFSRLNIGEKPQIIKFSKYWPGCWGTDSALVIFPEDRAIPRRVLRPMAVARRGSEPECPDSNDFCMGLIGMGRSDSDCQNTNILGTLGHRTQLWMEDGLSKDDCDYNQVDFDLDSSLACHGDSGGPVIYGPTGEIVANAGAATSDKFVGPALWQAQGSVRQWLHDNGLDRDHDGVEAAFDNCDTVYNPPVWIDGVLKQVDTDDDGVGDACDPCAWVPNEWEHDADDDGIVDCLDRCPNDPPDPSAPPCASGQDTLGDSDCDGKCDGVDPCPFMAGGALDANSNQLAEDVHLAHLSENERRFPDACEPVPVPNATAAPSEIVESHGTTSTFIDTYVVHGITNRIIVEPQPSRRAKNVKSGDAVIVPPGKIDTEIRFCQFGWDDSELACTHSSNVDDKLLYPGIVPEDENSSMPYRRITARLVNGPIRPRGYAFPFTYNGSKHELQWDYEADGAFWTNPAKFEPPLLIPPLETDIFGYTEPGPYSGVTGTLWLHGMTTAGVFGSNLGTGTHGDSSIVNTQKLSNRYFSLDPEWIKWGTISRPLIEALQKPLWFTLPDPPPWRMRIDNLVRPVEMMVSIAQSEVGLVNPDGRAQVISEFVGPGLRAALGDSSMSWVSSVENAITLTQTEEYPIAIALDGQGTHIANAVQYEKDPDGTPRFALLSERTHPTGSAMRLLAPPTPQSSLTPSPGANEWVALSMPPAEDFHTLYSRVHGAVLRVGGQDPTTRAPLGTLWRASLNTEAWQRVPLSMPLGKVLAATMTYLDGHVYVIDEVRTGFLRKGRFLRVEPVRGAVEVLASWPRLGIFDKVWLTLDPQGRLLLAASSQLLRTHQLYRLDIEPSGPRLAGFMLGQGELMAPVVADEYGLLFYRKGKGGVLSPQRRAATYLPCLSQWATLKDLR